MLTGCWFLALTSLHLYTRLILPRNPMVPAQSSTLTRSSSLEAGNDMMSLTVSPERSHWTSSPDPPNLSTKKCPLKRGRSKSQAGNRDLASLLELAEFRGLSPEWMCVFETHSHTQSLRPVEMSKLSLYRPGEAEWQSSPLVQALILVLCTEINILSFLPLGCSPIRTSNREERSPP